MDRNDGTVFQGLRATPLLACRFVASFFLLVSGYGVT